MLVLYRKVGERIVVGDKITITVVRMGQGNVRIGIDAPGDMAIVREELLHVAAKVDSPTSESPAEHVVELCDVTAAG
jgi:carbon storage regulator